MPLTCLFQENGETKVEIEVRNQETLPHERAPWCDPRGRDVRTAALITVHYCDFAQQSACVRRACPTRTCAPCMCYDSRTT